MINKNKKKQNIKSNHISLKDSGRVICVVFYSMEYKKRHMLLKTFLKKKDQKEIFFAKI